MDHRIYDLDGIDNQWCPGCGDFQILEALKKALAGLELPPEKVVLFSGIGQAAKTPHFMKGNFFNGLHGRSISNATGMKVANRALTVIAIGGDGDMYGEGGNHFVHTIRRNPDITNIAHNNMVYGLTKGQASPTSSVGFKTPVQVDGVFSEPFNPVAVAVALGASFVARAYSANIDQTVGIIKEAILHKGYALVDIFQPCVTFNKVNTYAWFKANTFDLPEDHDPTDRMAALQRALEGPPYPLGVLYKVEGRPTFEDSMGCYYEDDTPLYRRVYGPERIKDLLASFR
ncbi:MAG TPA: thiamine pyrophosphate-dependent enzyme [Synergistales bacterium]|nr:thiamine pyrophosphate-dependent enzyme [Synergistales bacterium]HPC75433.1 thiamine pyrophosphate-dependent enzyme [Synergistales bacterium]HRS48130.1 thiamine pyrophosphate-dependent enzyme [Thermovirgaceae bacterium]HRU90676.1 thiamine pyrophosphate-dependent enzyme [Thermovirgaceae bacterium]